MLRTLLNDGNIDKLYHFHTIMLIGKVTIVKGSTLPETRSAELSTWQIIFYCRKVV